MFETIVVRVILAGLVALTPADDGSKSALFLDGGEAHQTKVLLMEGGCEPAEDCVAWYDDDFPMAEEFALRWLLDDDSTGADGSRGLGPLDMRLVVDGRAVLGGAGTATAGGRARLQGELLSLPSQAGEVSDASWSPSLAALVGDEDAEFRKACVNGKFKECEEVSALFRIPRGRVGNCHLAHLPTYFLPPHNSCTGMAERSASPEAISPVWVLAFDFVDQNNNLHKTVREQAISNAFGVEFALGAGAGVKLEATDAKGKKRTVTLTPHGHENGTGVVTLLVVSNQSGNWQWPSAEALTKPHRHFPFFYDLFETPPERKWSPRARNFVTASTRSWVSPGWCEPYFDCLDTVFGPEGSLPGVQTTMKGEDLGVLSEMVANSLVEIAVPPHATSECDTAQHP